MSVIKVKIHEATGMPAGKQKLQYEVGICPSNAVFVSVFSHTNLVFFFFFFKEKVVPIEVLGRAEGMDFLSVQHTWLQCCVLFQQDRPLGGGISGISHPHYYR